MTISIFWIAASGLRPSLAQTFNVPCEYDIFKMIKTVEKLKRG
ncbi:MULTISPECIES: hypothetical protein [unclassified Rickettsia]